MTIVYNGTMLAHSRESAARLIAEMSAAIQKFNADGRPVSEASL